MTTLKSYINAAFPYNKHLKEKNILPKDIWVRLGNDIGKRSTATLKFDGQLRDGG